MAKKTNNIFSILDDSGDSNKANVDTLTAIVAEFGMLPNSLYIDDDVSNGWDYDKVAKIAYFLALQADPNAQEADVRSKITHKNIYEIAQYIGKAMELEMPEELKQLILDNIEMSKLDVMRSKLKPAQVNEIVNFVVEKQWLTAKDFEKATDEPAEDAESKN